MIFATENVAFFLYDYFARLFFSYAYKIKLFSHNKSQEKAKGEVMFFKHPIYFVASSAVGGHEEMSSPYASWFDFFHDRDTFGEDTYEKAESELSRISLNFLLNKAGMESHALSLLISGDLQNQCVASSYGLYTFGVPYLPLYGACSTCTEGLLVASLYLQATSESASEAVNMDLPDAIKKQSRLKPSMSSPHYTSFPVRAIR